MDSETDHTNREAYLIAAVELVRPLFAEAGATIPPVRVSVGWPGSRKGLRAIGSCWRKEASADGSFQIFVSPVLSDTVEALACLVHELAHAATNCSGHDHAFSVVARGIGLEGKLTSTMAGSSLTRRLNADVVGKLGQYPHAKLDPGQSGQKTQTTRLIKCVCPSSGYVVRTTRAWIEKYGTPISPITKKPMEVAA